MYLLSFLLEIFNGTLILFFPRKMVEELTTFAKREQSIAQQHFAWTERDARTLPQQCLRGHVRTLRRRLLVLSWDLIGTRLAW